MNSYFGQYIFEKSGLWDKTREESPVQYNTEEIAAADPFEPIPEEKHPSLLSVPDSPFEFDETLKMTIENEVLSRLELSLFTHFQLYLLFNEYKDEIFLIKKHNPNYSESDNFCKFRQIPLLSAHNVHQLLVITAFSSIPQIQGCEKFGDAEEGPAENTLIFVKNVTNTFFSQDFIRHHTPINPNPDFTNLGYIKKLEKIISSGFITTPDYDPEIFEQRLDLFHFLLHKYRKEEVAYYRTPTKITQSHIYSAIEGLCRTAKQANPNDIEVIKKYLLNNPVYIDHKGARNNEYLNLRSVEIQPYLDKYNDYYHLSAKHRNLLQKEAQNLLYDFVDTVFNKEKSSKELLAEFRIPDYYWNKQNRMFLPKKTVQQLKRGFVQSFLFKSAAQFYQIRETYKYSKKIKSNAKPF